jgi:GT2 family glycosyltransferase
MTPECDLGIVVIGRNEGERLRQCLDSVGGRGLPVVYVDSGSTDGSAGLAGGRGVDVVELDASAPFTAARGRNAGLDRLATSSPAVRFVQFVDGDCQVVDGWLEQGRRALEARPDVAIMTGRLRELHAEQSVYNRLAALEWDLPAGEVEACGGIMMARVSAVRQAGGFDPTLIAGEEPELCVRLRQQGWKIVRLDAEMAVHDAAMTRFGQWWQRQVRSGFAYAAGAARHGRSQERHWVRESRSNWFWGLLVPVASLAAAWPTRGLSLVLLIGYPALAARIVRYGRRRGWLSAEARLYAAHCVLAKFPMMLGQCRFLLAQLRGRSGGPIEYKGPAPTGAHGAAVDPDSAVVLDPDPGAALDPDSSASPSVTA